MVGFKYRRLPCAQEPRHTDGQCRAAGEAKMDLGLKGKRVLVTGGTRSIGRAIVRTFAAEGADVGFCARNAAEITALERQISGGANVARGRALDVTEEPALGAWIDEAASAMGGLDIFVANVSALGGAGGDDAESWRRSIEVDIMATVNALRFARAAIERTGGPGAIVVIGTVALVEVSGPSSPYRSVKAALVPYVKSLAIDLAPRNIRVNMVSPGTIVEDGNGWGRQRDAGTERYKRMLARNPTGRMGTPQEVADCVVWITSGRASFVSGANLMVDGAMTARVQY
jgi:3-oxoacyl-[acyl-carrier protein] reductase